MSRYTLKVTTLLPFYDYYCRVFLEVPNNTPSSTIEDMAKEEGLKFFKNAGYDVTKEDLCVAYEF